MRQKYEKSLIVIFNAEKKIPISRLRNGTVCIIYNPNGVRTWRRAYIEGIIGERPDFECKISVYRLFCPQLPINKNDNIEDIDVAIRLTLQAKPFHIKMQRADNKPKKFIACPSRLFAFDQWHLFITTMELYRLHRVDLVVVYIQSMPSTNTELDYNPNSETSWQNQLTNFQDCLYEFKESAEFIAFPDWDDFFFTSNYNIPYYPILQKFAEQNPKVNTFIIDRYMGYHESLDEMYINGHWMTDFWRQGIKYSTKDKQFFAGKNMEKLFINQIEEYMELIYIGLIE
uniref:Glycosyltransferase family 92 protein n=1 Tax=Meloidogyne enterolobii TaxID=390850 RepID=A0A6V7Y5S7_MELEN|nr:unnamed protein product [Meloidogyne enterolobii]